VDVVVERHALVVVGGGPAGVAAALEARRTGLDTCLVEQRPSLPIAGSRADELRSSGVTLYLGTACWGVWGHELALCGPDGPSRVVTADQLILATGSYERPVAFPGWTLPGVMTVGGALRLLSQGVLPGRRVLVAGYGRWAAAAASSLRAGGVDVVEVVDAAAGRIVIRADGDSALERATVAPVDADWCTTSGATIEVDVDTLVLAYGALPENQLARLAGCAVVGGAHVAPRIVRDAWLRTSAPGILVAGDAGGIVGEAAAIEQGRIAGRTAAIDAGPVVGDAPAETQGTAMEAPRRGLYALADESTVICRCEDVTVADITARIFPGSPEPGPVIAESRAAMGRCQGRNCASLVAAVIGRHTGQPIERIPSVTPRPPVVPVPVGALAARPPEFEAD